MRIKVISTRQRTSSVNFPTIFCEFPLARISRIYLHLMRCSGASVTIRLISVLSVYKPFISHDQLFFKRNYSISTQIRQGFWDLLRVLGNGVDGRIVDHVLLAYSCQQTITWIMISPDMIKYLLLNSDCFLVLSVNLGQNFAYIGNLIFYCVLIVVCDKHMQNLVVKATYCLSFR